MGQPGCNTHSIPGWNKSNARGSCGGNCGEDLNRYGGESKVKSVNAPVWKMTKDDWITFYASTLDCIGSTIWCIDHCISKTKPFPFDIKRIKPSYSIRRFTDLLDERFKDDFRKAKYVTLLGSGTLEVIDKNVARVITEIPKYWPDKFFRFFIRSKVLIKGKTLSNAKVIFSADKDTKIDLLEWAVKSRNVNSIAVINHKDNKLVIQYLKSQIKTVIDCNKCKPGICPTFKTKRKNLILLKYVD